MKMSMTLKYITTFSLFFCYFFYGVNFYVVGPTLIELSALFSTTIEKICFIYTVRSAGITVGSLRLASIYCPTSDGERAQVRPPANTNIDPIVLVTWNWCSVTFTFHLPRNAYMEAYTDEKPAPSMIFPVHIITTDVLAQNMRINMPDTIITITSGLSFMARGMDSPRPTVKAAADADVTRAAA
ncbi:unnamed protein product [Oppiella nova]|uniref:Uncharacterized protein n=1 Tax=Oppiella nova TaxID=334625 RepID=A0A7R9MFT7_9ACAR|nr:unnamed protein product [Oppiella nova]CAG2175609.1 unnamed protein product [Oppiella nova]